MEKGHIMTDEEKKRLLKLGKDLLSAGILYSSQNGEEKTEELDPSIARPGEKVIAIKDSAYIGIGYEINTGEIYTVSSYNKGSYTFEECPPSYNPYLGEDGTWWFNVKDFRKIEEE